MRLRSDMLWRGGQGVARSSSVRYGLSRRSRQGKVCWVELGHGGARRSRLGLFRYGRIWLGMMGRGGRGAVR